MAEAFRDPAFAKGPFPALYDLIAPAAVDVNRLHALALDDLGIANDTFFL